MSDRQYKIDGRKALGYFLIALPFLAIAGVFIVIAPWQVLAGVGAALVMAACVVGGVWLLEDDDW